LLIFQHKHFNFIYAFPKDPPSTPASDLEPKMKLIVAGAADLLGMEIVRQSLQLRKITEVIALTRRPVQLEKGIDSSKLRIVLIRDYGNYPDSVKAEFARADACI
jgi:nucleoside-diphosphate-sugar epimerase